MFHVIEVILFRHSSASQKIITILLISRLDQDGRVVKALDLSSIGRIVRVGFNPTPGIILPSILNTQEDFENKFNRFPLRTKYQ